MLFFPRLASRFPHLTRRRIEIMRTPTRVLLAALAVTFSARPAAAADEIKVGALFAVTGPASFLGAPEARTLEMLVADLNARGGVAGKKVKLIIKDTAASPEKAISFAKQLIEEEQVFAIIGPSTSGETMAVKNLAEESKTLLLSCAAAAVIVNPVAKYVFKTPQDDASAVTRIFTQMKKMGLTKIGLLSSNTGFGKAGKEQVAKLAPQHGIQILVDEVYDKAATDLTAEVTKLKAANVQAVVNWSIEPAQAIVIKNLRQIGLKVPIFQSHGFGNINYVKAAGAAAEGVIFPAGRLLVADHLADKHPQKALLVSYKKSYEAKYSEDVSTFGGHAYDAFLILEAALKKVGPDREKVRTAIEGLTGLVGTAGIFNFSPADHNGLALDAFEMLTVKDGKFAVLAD
jgi:branched-chain amino acid transport system substrate-binding protein